MGAGAAPKPALAKQFRVGPAGIDITINGDQAAMLAIAAKEPFPDWHVRVGDITARAATGEPFRMAAPMGGAVEFSGAASAFAGIGLYIQPADLIAGVGIADELKNGLQLPSAEGWGFCLLRWGYDVNASAEGSVALAGPAKVTFGVDGSRERIFAVVRRFQRKTSALDVVTQTVASWNLPGAIHANTDLKPDTWLIAEVDGTIACKLAGSYGYDFNWVRQLNTGDLSGDIGLKLNAAITAALGFDAAGRFATVVSREAADSDGVRLRIFKLAKKGWSFSFNGGVNATVSENLTPEKFEDFVLAVLGLHGSQILKDLHAIEEWSASDHSLSGALAGLAPSEFTHFVTKVTNTNVEVAFEAAKNKLLALLKAWDALPSTVASTLWAHIPDQAALDNIASIATQIANANQDTVQARLEQLLGKVDFFNTPSGKWLEAAAGGAVIRALTGTHEFAELQQAARQTADLLDPHKTLAGVLTNLQHEMAVLLHLDTMINDLKTALRQKSPSQVNPWLRAKLANLIGNVDDIEELKKADKLIEKIREKAPEFYAKAIRALNHTYGFAISARYQSSDASTALVDATFDLSQAPAGERYRDVLKGRYDEFLLHQIPGVTLRKAVLTHDAQRHWHVEVEMPFCSSTADEIVKSLAKANAVDEADGRVLVYELNAEDSITARNRRDSRLAIAAFYPIGAVRKYGPPTMSCNYSYVWQQARLKRPALVAQLKPYVDAYFPAVFHENSRAGSFSEWMGDLDKYIDQLSFNGTDNFGDARVRLEVALPPTLASFWLKLDASETRRRFPAMSRSIQDAVRRLIYTYHFADVTRFGDVTASTALLIYAALPVSTSIANGDPVRFNTDKQLYWNYRDVELRRAVIRDPHTGISLARLLDRIQDTLRSYPGLQTVRGFYDPNGAGVLQAAACVTESDAERRLVSLLGCEAQLVEGAAKAAEDMLDFLDKKNESPSKAVKILSKFGEHATHAFHDIDLYTGDAIRPLCPLLIATMARALCPEIDAAPSSAMLSIAVMRAGKPLPSLASDLSSADLVVQQRLLSL